MAICAYIRLTLATFYLICFGKLNDQTCEPNAVFVDQISAPLPFLRWFARFVSSDDKFKIIFYGHFPDQLLAVNRTTRLARLYRAPIDWFEQWANRFADLMLVNSRFTERVFRQTFPTLVNFPMHVVYPACNFASLNIEQQADLEQEKNEPKEADWKSESTVFLSLNRFERKKNIGLAIEALSELVHNHHETAVKLLIAGGYDLRIKENVDYEFELKQLARKLNVDKQVFFVRSPNDMMKARLIRSCHVLLYTPENEHFGIVPLEAMYCSRPVLSAASGGPLETVVNGQTGYHCESNITDWAQKMLRLHSDHETAHALGQAGRKHVLANFAFEAFQQQMNQVWEL